MLLKMTVDVYVPKMTKDNRFTYLIKTGSKLPHHRPHFHAYYQDDVGVYAIDTIELIAGQLPRR